MDRLRLERSAQNDEAERRAALGEKAKEQRKLEAADETRRSQREAARRDAAAADARNARRRATNDATRKQRAQDSARATRRSEDKQAAREVERRKGARELRRAEVPRPEPKRPRREAPRPAPRAAAAPTPDFPTDEGFVALGLVGPPCASAAPSALRLPPLLFEQMILALDASLADGREHGGVFGRTPPPAAGLDCRARRRRGPSDRLLRRGDDDPRRPAGGNVPHAPLGADRHRRPQPGGLGRRRAQRRRSVRTSSTDRRTCPPSSPRRAPADARSSSSSGRNGSRSPKGWRRFVAGYRQRVLAAVAHGADPGRRLGAGARPPRRAPGISPSTRASTPRCSRSCSCLERTSARARRHRVQPTGMDRAPRRGRTRRRERRRDPSLPALERGHHEDDLRAASPRGPKSATTPTARTAASAAAGTTGSSTPMQTAPTS